MIGYMNSKSKNSQKIITSSGKFGFVYALDQLLESTEEGEYLFHFGESDNFASMVGDDYFSHWIERRITAGVHAKVIARSDSLFTLNQSQNDEQALRECKFVFMDKSMSHYSVSGNSKQIIIWNSSLVEVTKIRDQSLAQLVKIMFEMAWGGI
jgi:hypothetical protein